jgi:microcystin-dependent protein
MNRQMVSKPVSQTTRKIPPGTVAMWPSDTIPNGWLICNGNGYASATYPALYAVIGTYYGSTGGFQVPDLRTRVPYGVGSTYGAVGTTGGSAVHAVTAQESFLKDHTHTYSDFYADVDVAVCTGSGASSINTVVTRTNNTTQTYSATTLYSDGFDGYENHTNLQPYVLLNYIIKT